MRYEDLVAAVDVVVTKPGYGIVSECIANDTAMLYTSRGHFVEYEVMVREMPSVLRCRFLDQQSLLDGRWLEALDDLLASPPPPLRPDTNGAEAAADAILRRINDFPLTSPHGYSTRFSVGCGRNRRTGGHVPARGATGGGSPCDPGADVDAIAGAADHRR